MTVREKLCRQALNKTGIPGFDYCVNPYTGCAHGCLYCYATFMKKYSGHEEPWGSFVDVKTSIVGVLRKEVRRRKPGRVVIGSVCDPHQPVEAGRCLTRGVIQTLTERRFPFQILTKSSLVARDIDLLRGFSGASVEMTITTFNEDVRELFEPGASPAKDRVKAVFELVRAGINTGVFIGPVLPYFSDTTQRLKEMFSVFETIGVRSVLVDKLNHLNSKLPVLLPVLKKHFPEAVSAFREAAAHPAQYTARLHQTVADARRANSLKVEPVF